MYKTARKRRFRTPLRRQSLIASLTSCSATALSLRAITGSTHPDGVPQNPPEATFF